MCIGTKRKGYRLQLISPYQPVMLRTLIDGGGQASLLGRPSRWNIHPRASLSVADFIDGLIGYVERPLRRKPLFTFGASILLLALITVVRLGLQTKAADTAPFLVYLPAILLVSFIGGARQGHLATVLAVVLAFWMLPSPSLGSSVFTVRAELRPIIALLASSFLVLLVGSLRQTLLRLRDSEERLRQANEQFEERVRARTQELTETNLRLSAQIAERERVEAAYRQAQKMEAVGRLTGGVAHDFNNLLTAIIGNLELLRERGTGVDERSKQTLDGAMRVAERGATLTSHLLAFARQQPLAPVPVDLNEVVVGMNGLVRSTVGQSIKIETALADDLALTIADPTQLELLILNLVINARDAMPGGGRIIIETSNVVCGSPQRPEEPPPGEYVAVSVRDTGSGIPPEIIDRVFDPFFSTKEVGKGSGLGLSRVLGVAQQLGGGVHIDTRLGEGTAVAVLLPLAFETRQPVPQARFLDA
jgi:signal transduction histidine kinase